ncbi:MAG: hypothetical protein K5650_00805 [Bacteroidales bacterium]|nr:hypothetical protein [Bacteroidales bacterium]
MPRRAAIALAAFLAAALAASADDWDVHRCSGPGRPTGLAAYLNAGMLWADNNVANFYNGNPNNANTVERLLYSNTYGQQIWQDLTEADLIASSVSHYSMLTVAEYGNMRYEPGFQIGMGFRYDYRSGLGWMLRFDLAQLTAVGAFNIDATNSSAVLEQRGRYVRCGLSGKENRINIDLGLTFNTALTRMLDLDIAIGVNANNTKVIASDMTVAGRTYSILDIWGGETPNYNVGSYEYLNQGGLGAGEFGALALCWHFEGVGRVSLGYNLYHTRINLEGYSADGWQHNLYLRFEINNFIFI